MRVRQCKDSENFEDNKFSVSLLMPDKKDNPLYNHFIRQTEQLLI